MHTPASRDSTSADNRLGQLLERIAREDADALRALYDLTAPKLFGVALRILVRREWAEEVLQESYVNIWRFARDYHADVSAPMTWLTAIVRHRALDFLRRRPVAEMPWDDGIEDTLPGSASNPSDQALLSREAAALARCLQTLEPAQRQAIALAYLRDLSHGEVAQSLQVPLGTVKSWIRRGLMRLKLCLEGHST